MEIRLLRKKETSTLAFSSLQDQWTAYYLVCYIDYPDDNRQSDVTIFWPQVKRPRKYSCAPICLQASFTTSGHWRIRVNQALLIRPSLSSLCITFPEPWAISHCLLHCQPPFMQLLLLDESCRPSFLKWLDRLQSSGKQPARLLRLLDTNPTRRTAGIWISHLKSTQDTRRSLNS